MNLSLQIGSLPSILQDFIVSLFLLLIRLSIFGLAKSVPNMKIIYKNIQPLHHRLFSLTTEYFAAIRFKAILNFQVLYLSLRLIFQETHSFRAIRSTYYKY